MENINIIKERLASINLELSDEKLKKLDQYGSLIAKWNKAYNLVGKSTLEEVFSRHILDSLQLVQYIKKEDLKNSKILDFGAGAGMPSVMLAIVLDDVKITACERIGKKCQFLNQVRRELALTNFSVVQEDVRNINEIFDIVTCRAVASIEDIFNLTGSLKKNSQVYLLPKGRNYIDEIEHAKTKGYSFNFDVFDSVLEDDSVVLRVDLK